MAKIQDFFIQENSVNYIPENHYEYAVIIKKVISAIPRASRNNIYIIDYYKKNFLYVSSGALFLCGHTSDYVMKQGYSFYQENVSPKEFDMLAEINKACFELFDSQPQEKRLKFTSSYDFHLGTGQNKKLINHKLTPILLTKDGHIWLALCAVSLSVRHKAGNVEIYKEDSDNYWFYSLKKRLWETRQKVRLSPAEHDVLMLLGQGYKTSEIAEKRFCSTDTIKSCKKGIYQKFNVRSSKEALFSAELQGLL